MDENENIARLMAQIISDFNKIAKELIQINDREAAIINFSGNEADKMLADKSYKWSSKPKASFSIANLTRITLLIIYHSLLIGRETNKIRKAKGQSYADWYELAEKEDRLCQNDK